MRPGKVKTMIVVRVEGGLGNQMFQVAFGMQLAHRLQTELVLDLASYAGRPEHGYLLNRFHVGARELSNDERRRLPRRYRQPSPRLSPSGLLGLNGLRRLREKPFGFAEKYLRARDNSYLVGYWQSEKFFSDVQSQVRDQFQLCVPLSAESQRMREMMLGTPSVAVHIRRGDYVTNATAASIYRTLSVEYYRQRIMHYLASRANARVFVFSNDIAWCRSQLGTLPGPVHFVDHTTAATAHEDLWLMTAAECQIIANSTFSWWGAWLSTRSDQRVIAPRHWFHPGTLDDQHLPCDGWSLAEDVAGHAVAA